MAGKKTKTKTKVKKASKRGGKTEAFGKMKGGALIAIGASAPSRALERAFDAVRRICRKERINFVGVVTDVQKKSAIISTTREPHTYPEVRRAADILAKALAEPAEPAVDTAPAAPQTPPEGSFADATQKAVEGAELSPTDHAPATPAEAAPSATDAPSAPTAPVVPATLNGVGAHLLSPTA